MPKTLDIREDSQQRHRRDDDEHEHNSAL
jgi:hypothetical protein